MDTGHYNPSGICPLTGQQVPRKKDPANECPVSKEECREGCGEKLCDKKCLTKLKKTGEDGIDQDVVLPDEARYVKGCDPVDEHPDFHEHHPIH